MWKILEKFQADFLQSIIDDWITLLQDICKDLSRATFFIEELADSILSVTAVASAYEVLYIFCSMLLVGKLLWKGWNVYVLWNGGDPEVAPGEMLKGAAWAIVVTAAFPTAYELGVAIALEIIETVLRYFNLSNLGFDGSDSGFWGQLSAALTNVTSANGFTILMSLVFVILLIIMVFKMLGQGAELFVFRLGVPFAAIGLVNSDGGAWTNYIQMLLKQIFSVMVQYFCVVIGAKVMAIGTTKAIAVGIAFEITAFAAPKLLSQVLAPKSGGGMMQKVYTLSMIARTFLK